MGVGGNGRLGLMKIGNMRFVVMVGDGILTDSGEYLRIAENTCG
jgi:hypothetical protein